MKYNIVPKSYSFIEDDNGYNCVQFVVEGDEELKAIVVNEISIRGFSEECMFNVNGRKPLFEIEGFEGLTDYCSEEVTAELKRFYKNVW